MIPPYFHYPWAAQEQLNLWCGEEALTVSRETSGKEVLSQKVINGVSLDVKTPPNADRVFFYISIGS